MKYDPVASINTWSSTNQKKCPSYKLATRVAFRRLSLTITGEVVRTAAFVATGEARGSGSEASPKPSCKAPSRHHSTSTSAGKHSWASLQIAVCAHALYCSSAIVNLVANETYSHMSRLATIVTTPTSPTATQAQCWAICLHVSKTLTMVALFRCKKN